MLAEAQLLESNDVQEASQNHRCTTGTRHAGERSQRDARVRAYEKEEEFRQFDLAGAISLGDFRKARSPCPKTRT